MLWATSLITGILAMMFSEISSPSYTGLVSLALGCGALCLITGVRYLKISKNRSKWALLLVLLPVIVFTIDNAGRFLKCMGLPGFRTLI